MRDKKETSDNHDASRIELVNRPADEGDVLEHSRDTAGKGMFVDPAYTPTTLYQPTMQAGQSDNPEEPVIAYDSSAEQPEAADK